MNDLSFETLRQLVELETNEHCFGCSEERVCQTGKVLGVHFPHDYRFFLQQFNGGDFYGATFTLFSIPDENTHIKAADNLGANNRPGAYAELSIPNRYLIIGVFNFGDLICLDPDSGRVIQWDVENDSVFLDYDSFFDFFKESDEEFRHA